MTTITSTTRTHASYHRDAAPSIEAGRLLTDAEALAVAAAWHSPGRIGRVLSRFAGSGQADAHALAEDLDATQSTYPDAAADMAALRRWTEHKTSQQDAPRLACPQCGDPDHLATADIITGYALLGTDANAADYVGETDVDWNSQHSEAVTCRDYGWRHDLPDIDISTPDGYAELLATITTQLTTTPTK